MKRQHRAIFLIGTFFIILTAYSKVYAENPPPGMVAIKAGCFIMGSDEDYIYPLGFDPNDREKPAHKVCLDAFYLDTHETTQKQWETAMGYNHSVLLGDDLPAEHITWEQALTYCIKQGKRLPTEAEWEYAAKAGSTAANFWGDGIDGDYAWYDLNSQRQPHPVGTKKPNPWGLYDMMGSVWEWTWDWFEMDYYKENPPEKNPKGPKFPRSYHVIKGASWLDEEGYFRAALRHRGMSDPTETFLVGVRCAKSIK